MIKKLSNDGSGSRALVNNNITAYVLLVKRSVSHDEGEITPRQLTESGKRAAGAHRCIFHVFSSYCRIEGLSLGY
ncbi:hypothetical protein WN55_07539 [Dufourea novaeangliae]|uniref:Uncharacterized protein n=1 Tax=Dufourea novaeangliae TaxID=178035 RepID=A0A154P4C0_DUFNO|nr:hypothetical protein WN55_07539 [Dufourea novaeangliae]